jgi:hypothetical protein
LVRVRFLAGILGLTALLLSLAEAAWASICSPAMELGSLPAAGESPAAEAAQAAGMPAGHCGHHAEPGFPRPDSPQPEAPAPGSCPFTPMSLSSCAAAVSMPAEVRLSVASPFGRDLLSPTYPDFFEILLTEALFHPPKP